MNYEREIHTLTVKSITYELFYIEIYHDEKKKKAYDFWDPGAFNSLPLKARQASTRKRGRDRKRVVEVTVKGLRLGVDF